MRMASKQSGIIPNSMALLPQDTFAEDYVVTAAVHSRLPRLDLGIDWVPRWEEFCTSLRGALTGPKVSSNETVSGGEDLRGFAAIGHGVRFSPRSCAMQLRFG